MLEIRELTSLRALADHDSFDAAARSLGVTPGAMSQRIKQIEEKLGQIIVVRSSPIRLTNAGIVLLRLAKQVDLLMNEALYSLTDEEAAASITVAVNHDSLASWFLHAITDFAFTSSATIDIRCADQAVTSSLLRSGEAVAAISAEQTAPQGCETILLGGLDYVAVSNPEFATRWFGSNEKPEYGCPFIMFDRTDSLSQRIAGESGYAPEALHIHYLPDSNTTLSAAIMGLGWAVIPHSLATRALAEGALVPVMPSSKIIVPLYLHHWRLGSSTLKLLIECIRRAGHSQLSELRA